MIDAVRLGARGGARARLTAWVIAETARLAGSLGCKKQKKEAQTQPTPRADAPPPGKRQSTLVGLLPC